MARLVVIPAHVLSAVPRTCSSEHCWAHMRAGAMLAIAFVHNLLRRHPACNVLLHRPSPKQPTKPAEVPVKSAAGAKPHGPAAEDDGEEAHPAAAASQEQVQGPLEESSPAAAGLDPYLPDEEDPAESRAIDSSLWEMDSLRKHYCPQASCSNCFCIS